LSLRTAREHLRVAHALADLPAIAEAFAGGRISYSKVRAMARVATSQTERGLLNIALHGTASHVETVVAATRAANGARPEAQRGMHWRRASDGSLLVSLRLPAEEGAQLVAAIEAVLAEEDGSADRPRSSPRRCAGAIRRDRATRPSRHRAEAVPRNRPSPPLREWAKALLRNRLTPPLRG
jgi:hypothetical protein